jgi:cytochrome c peroxidase
MTKTIFTLLSPLIAAAAFSASTVLAAGNTADSPGLQTTRPSGYKPIAGDAKLGAQLWQDTKLSSNGMACASCHANHGAFQPSFVQAYPHTVQMAKDQLGRTVVHLDEMVQACMVMPMAAKPLPWDSRELAALVAYVRLEQKSFQASATSTK